MPVTSPSIYSRWAIWAAWAACGWAFLFAALSFFWAAGGRTGIQPLELQAASDRAIWVLINLGTGAGKLLIGLFALACLLSWGRFIPHKLLQIGAWLLGIGMLLYGGAGLVSDILHVAGVVGDPAQNKWFFWYLVVWDPWWMLGGLLFIAVAWLTRRQP